MKSFIVCLLIGAATAAQLPNSYIPPNRQSAGGNSQFLQTPKSSQFGGKPSSQYGPPAGSGFGASSQQSQYAPAGGKSQSADAQATILKYENNPNIGDGTYNYEYETSNGIKVQEQGYNTQQGPENSEQIVTGSYSYTGDDGQVYTVTYKADANGFQAEGAHLPTPPPIPADIQKSLDFIAASQSQQSSQPQSYASNNQQPQRIATNNQPQGYASNKQQSYNSQTGYQY